ncbi:hypothetical protein Q0F99_20480 [Rathayibacter oskolensis]|nr:hypothetical protein [Rathayibacter oskolensis]WKK71640.1 hypothetical protein Q0F99_20480 [Rathayibacter oskolensis]
MWDDARFWLPGVLTAGEAARWSFEFGADLASVVDSDAPGWPGG